MALQLEVHLYIIYLIDRSGFLLAFLSSHLCCQKYFQAVIRIFWVVRGAWWIGNLMCIGSSHHSSYKCSLPEGLQTHSYCSAFDQIPTESKGTKSQEKYHESHQCRPLFVHPIWGSPTVNSQGIPGESSGKISHENPRDSGVF